MSTLFKFTEVPLVTVAKKKKMYAGTISIKTKQIDPESKGVSRTAVINILHGKSVPNANTLALICAALGISPKSKNLWIPVET